MDKEQTRGVDEAVCFIVAISLVYLIVLNISFWEMYGVITK